MNANKLRRYFSKNILFPGKSVNSTPDAMFMFIYLLCKWLEQGEEKNFEEGHRET